MKRVLLILSLLALLAAGCYREPFADASITPNPAYVGEDIYFLNLSQNTTASEWDMDDGTIFSSTNPLHSYIYPGLYEVTLDAFGKKGDVSRATFLVDVVGSEITIEVREYWDEYLIEGASVLLFEDMDDWNTGDIGLAVDEQFTNRYGQCVFSNLGAKRYYVDVYYRVGNEGYHNYFLAEEDIGFIETQELPGGYDHLFIAYVDAVVWDAAKSAGTEYERPALRAPYTDTRSLKKGAPEKRELKENKFSTKK